MTPQQLPLIEGHRRNRRFRKGIYLLPSLFTTLNIALGYYAGVFNLDRIMRLMGVPL